MSENCSCPICMESLKDRVNNLDQRIQKVEMGKADVADVRDRTQLARENIDARLASMNEFREQIKDQTATFFTRREHEIYMENVDKLFQSIMVDIRGLRESRAQMEGKASQTSVSIGYILTVAALVLAIVAIVR